MRGSRMIREEELRRLAETGVCLGEVRESETPIRLRSGQATSAELLQPLQFRNAVILL